MPDYTRTTKLKGVNTMLSVIGESPINSLSGSLPVDAVLAVSILDETCVAVQSQGWHCNTETDVELAPDDDGYINVATNVVEVDVNPAIYTDIDPVLRGSRLYDKKNQTAVFDRTLKAEVTYLLDFEDLMEPLKRYIIIKAARVFQSRFPGDAQANAFVERDELEALTALQAADARTADRSIFESYDAARVLDR